MSYKYHAFISYHSKFQAEARELRDYIRNANFQTFFDKCDVRAGDIYQDAIEQALQRSACIVVVVGPLGLGPWQKQETLSALWSSVVESKRIIPVVLPGASLETEGVPSLLRIRSAVIFSENLKEGDNLQQLYDGLINCAVPVGPLEKPLTADEAEQLHISTVRSYDNPTRAEQFFEAWRDDIPISKLEMLLKKLVKGAKVLDAGCGPGHHSHYLSRQGFDVDAIDLSAASLDIASKTATTHPRPTFQKMDMRNMSFRRNTFDAIWASASCVHTPDSFLDRQLQEFLKVIKPGGHLGITLQIDRLPAIEEDGRFFEGYRNVDLVRNRLNVVGFEVLDQATDITTKTTDGITKATSWLAFVAKAGEKGTVSVGNHP